MDFELVIAVVACDCDPRGDRDLDCGFYGSDDELVEAYHGFSQEQRDELDELVRVESRWLGEDASSSFVEFYA
jgi:hypothetical protein